MLGQRSRSQRVQGRRSGIDIPMRPLSQLAINCANAIMKLVDSAPVPIDFAAHVSLIQIIGFCRDFKDALFQLLQAFAFTREQADRQYSAPEQGDDHAGPSERIRLLR
jgi:hypothetical protein